MKKLFLFFLCAAMFCINGLQAQVSSDVSEGAYALQKAFDDSGLDKLDIKLVTLSGALKEGDNGGWICSVLSQFTNLETLDMGAIIGDFTVCSNLRFANLKSVTFPQGTTSIGSNAFSGCTKLTTISLPKAVKSIGSSAFWHCTGLNEIIMLDGLENIGDMAFGGCTNLTGLSIPSTVTRVGGSILTGCSGVELSIVTKEVERWSSALAGCNDLSVTLLNGNVADYAFQGSSGLVYFHLLGNTIGNNAFYGCTALKEIRMINVSHIGSSAFMYCTGLNEIEIPPAVSSISESTFRECTGLTRVYMPAVTTIGDQAFRGCTELTDAFIPLGVTSIGSYSFSECRKLTTIRLLSSVATIGNQAFTGINLEKVYSHNWEPPALTGTYTFGGVNKCTLYVPARVKDLYMKATQWKDFGTIEGMDVNLSKTETSILAGKTETITATLVPEDAIDGTLVWTSNDESVATVEAGTITAHKAGTANITVAADGFSDTCKVTVIQPVIGVSLSKTSTSLIVGASETLDATVQPTDAANKAVKWISSNPSVTTVDETGKVTAVLAGTAYITVTTEDGNKTAACTVTVTITSQPGTSVVEGMIANAPTGTMVFLYLQGSNIKATGLEDYMLVASTVTDANCRYRFENLPEGNYKVVVQMTGYNSQPSADIVLTGTGSVDGIDFKVNSADHTIKPGDGLTGIEIADTPLARVYPNPTSGLVTLNFEAPGTYRITITDATGKIIFRQTISDQIKQMNIENYPAGMYLLLIDNGKKKSVVKIVKEKK